MRLFVALNPTPEARSFIEQNVQLLRRQIDLRGVKWMAPENVHLTLQFMGEVDAQLVPEIVTALRAACAQTAPFELQIGGIGCFPDVRKPRVIWLGLEGGVLALRQLQGAIARDVKPFHAQHDNKAFTPHLTLARIKTFDRDEARSVGRAVQTAELPRSEWWPVNSVELIQSELTPRGPVYTSLAEVEL